MNDQVQSMIDWMEATIRTKFSLDALADYMGYSPYYCSFKFHQAAGMTIRRYILLRRLYLSTDDLLAERRIIEIALDYDYSSQEAYSRAFKAVFGITPKEFQLMKLPVQSFAKLTLNNKEEWRKVSDIRKTEVEKLKQENSAPFEHEVLNICNGQAMYDDFKRNQLMGNSDYVPFNEAMCVNRTTPVVFSKEFIEVRASGHQDTVDHYTSKVIDPLVSLFRKQYRCIVLWFGEDMFCQMNLLTLLAYLEQSGYKGQLFLHSFREDEFKVNQIELQLGSYSDVYKTVFMEQQKPTCELLPVMYQSIDLYLEMLQDDNRVTKYIAVHSEWPTAELVQNLFEIFPNVGYGDSQYIELIRRGKIRQR